MGEEVPAHIQAQPRTQPPSPASTGKQPTLHLDSATPPKPSIERVPTAEILSPTMPMTPNPFLSRHNTLDIDDYFVGPRDISKHSKWPLFMRMHGSILPKMIVPLLWVGAWSSTITCITMLEIANLGTNPVLLTITGFVVGLGLSFRSSTAYERYNEGRRYWAQLTLASQNLGRAKAQLLQAMTCTNLIVAFAIALKHKLRFEPYTVYDDLAHLVAHLQTFAGTATADDPSKAEHPPKNIFKEVLKKANMPLGNLPLEILSYLGRCTDKFVAEGKLPVPMQQTLAYNNLLSLNDVLTGTERLCTALGWVTIPASIAASYIILGILFIGREIENPFGQDVNDLPLEHYCEQVAIEMDIIAAQAMHLENLMEHVESGKNRVLFPVSSASYTSWKMRPEQRLREAIKLKPQAVFDQRTHHEGDLAAAKAETVLVGEKKV
ncbi:unnamed protein product [Parascedosporium putredinis]|uniref:Uncharacterized protein n=1 Tax=Parascedosporium putredinis TaxID=1442378 RepID=A0A9P1M9P2_9PEZI|nr:unnamed protein product [Parascedosporium putredinis]CAI7991187.1 unnamed protein product [Parascedosporium putredinis]